MNLMSVDGYSARIEYDAETDQFGGEILGLNGGADFYGANPDALRQEFKKSLDVFLEVCKEKGIEPRKHFSDKFNLRIPPTPRKKLAIAAQAQGKVSIHLPTRHWRKVSSHGNRLTSPS